MNPFGTRGAAEFASALDGGTAVALPGLALAARLRTVGADLDEAVVPRAEFRDALRMRLMAVATVQAAAPAAAVPVASAVSWRRRTGAVAAGAMASVVTVTGVAVAGSQSLPGDPFYGVKRTGESVQLRAADGALERGTVHLQHAGRRLDEVAALTRGRDVVALTGPVTGGVVAGGGSADLVIETLADMDEATDAGRRLLLRASDDGADTAPLARLTTFATEQDAALSDLVDELPLAAREEAEASLALVDDVRTQALALLLDGLAPTPEPPAPPVPAPPLPLPLPETPVAPAPGSTPEPAASSAPQEPTPTPAPSPGAPAPDAGSDPAPRPAPSASPSRPAPRPSLEVPLPPLPVPLPLPTSVPLPLPAPTLSPPPLPLPLPTSLPTIGDVLPLPGLLTGAAVPAPSLRTARPVPSPLPEASAAPPA